MAYVDPDAGNFINANSPLSVQVSGFKTAGAASASTEPSIQFTSNSAAQALSFPLYNVTGIAVQNGRSLPLTSTGSFSLTVTNTVNAGNDVLSTLTESATPLVLLNPSNGQTYNRTTATSNINYNQQNGQQTAVTLSAGSGSKTGNVRQYYTFSIAEQPVPQNSLATDSLGFGVYNTTAGSSQTQVLQLNYSTSGKYNNATYMSSQSYTIPVQT